MRKSLLKKNIAIIFFSGLTLLLLPHHLFALEITPQLKSKLNWVMENIKEREKSLKTFTAKFVQSKKTCLLKEPLRSEGLIFFDYSGKILFKVTSPSPLTVLLRNDTLIIYYPDLSKTEETYLGDNILKRYFGIGQSVEGLEKQYEIQLVSGARSDNYHLKLIPKTRSTGRHIALIEVFVNAGKWLPEQIHFKETKGDRTSLWLEFTSINEPLPQGIFNGYFPQDYDTDF